MNRKLLFVIPVFLPAFAFSQSMTTNVLSSQGGYDRSEKITLEWTLGEPVTETRRTANNVVTQGFQQPMLKWMHVKNEAPGAVTVYPNPVSTTLHIQMPESGEYAYVAWLFRRDGLCVRSVTIPAGQSKTQIDMSAMPGGLYLLKLRSTSGTHSVTYRIIKNQ